MAFFGAVLLQHAIFTHNSYPIGSSVVLGVQFYLPCGAKRPGCEGRLIEVETGDGGPTIGLQLPPARAFTLATDASTGGRHTGCMTAGWPFSRFS